VRPVFRSRVFLVVAAAGVVVTAACFVLRAGGGANESPLYTVRRQALEVVVNALGELDSEKAVTIASELREEAKIVGLVDDGARVKAGNVVVRFDAAPFEERVNLLNSKVNQYSALVAATQQALEWEKLQGEREIDTAKVDREIALLDLQKVESGDGPLELSRLEGLTLDARKKHEEFSAYLKDLRGLAQKGFVNATEVDQAMQEAGKYEKTYQNARQQYESYKTYVLPSLLNSLRAKAERARMLMEQSTKAAGLKIGKVGAELEQSRRELDNQRELLQAARTQLDKAVVRAPQAGLVVLRESFQSGEFRKPRIGDKALPSQPLLFLPDISGMIARVLVREVDLGKVALKKAVVITVDACPGVDLRGSVSFVGVLAERRQEVRDGEKYFKVTIAITTRDDRLRPGMTARARIISAADTERLLVVPVHAVFERDGRSYCFVRTPGGFEMREVSLGMPNDQMVQVRKGLSEGEQISLARPKPDVIGLTRPL